VSADALVVGAAGGIGGAVVDMLRDDRGATVRTVDRAGEVDVAVDLSDLSHDSAYSRWLASLEGPHVIPPLVVWTAAVYDRRPPEGYDDARLQHVIDVNLTSFLRFAAVLARAQLVDGIARRLVVVGSQAAVAGGTDAVYAASKAGLVAAVKSLAREHRSLGLVANVVSPGPTDTPMAAVMGDRREHYEDTIPLGRFNDAAEVAAAVVWLLCSAPDAILGTVVDVDGGLVRR